MLGDEIERIKMFLLYRRCSALLFYSALCLIYLIESGHAIHCYMCDTIDDPLTCSDPFNDTLIQPVECINDNYACLKETLLDEKLNQTYLSRRCVQKHYCEVKSTSSDLCASCTYDYCNSSPKNYDVYLATIFGVFLSTTFTFKCF